MLKLRHGEQQGKATAARAAEATEALAEEDQGAARSAPAEGHNHVGVLG